MAKYKPGMFIKTPLGKMRVKMDKQWLPCEKCALYNTEIFAEKNPCHQLAEMHKASCVDLVTEYGYFEKV